MYSSEKLIMSFSYDNVHCLDSTKIGSLQHRMAYTKRNASGVKTIKKKKKWIANKVINNNINSASRLFRLFNFDSWTAGGNNLYAKNIHGIEFYLTDEERWDGRRPGLKEILEQNKRSAAT